MNDQPDPCLALGCERIILDVTDCERWRCCYAWTRRSREDRERRIVKDRRTTEGAA